MQPSSSVEIAIWVAVGGRGTLAGAIVGALLVNGAKSWLTVAFPTAWLFVLGMMFVVVVLVVPGGVVEAFGGIRRSKGFLAKALGGIAPRGAPPPPPPEKVEVVPPNAQVVSEEQPP
jgi:zinc transporter ZupT